MGECGCDRTQGIYCELHGPYPVRSKPMYQSCYLEEKDGMVLLEYVDGPFVGYRCWVHEAHIDWSKFVEHSDHT